MASERWKLQELTCQWTAEVWKAHRAGHALEGEALDTAICMEKHPEWWHVWDSLPTAQDTGILVEGPDGNPCNPLLHLTVDAAVKRQLDQEDPKEIRQIYNWMTAVGVEDLEAMHVIGRALSGELWEILKYGRTYDEARYLSFARRYAQEEIRRRKNRRT